MIRLPARAPWARAMAGTFKVTAARMMGVIRGCMTNPRGSLKGLGMGLMLMPIRLAMSSTGKTVKTPVRRSIKDLIGPERSSALIYRKNGLDPTKKLMSPSPKKAKIDSYAP